MKTVRARRKLDRQQILDAALSLVDEEGLEQLSMRRLGGVLAVEAMSLYNHFRNKSELLDALHGRLLEEMPRPSSGSEGDWKSQALQAAMSFQALLRAHPRAIPLVASRAAVSRGSLAYFDGGVSLFLRAGLSPLASVRAFQSVFAFVVGHATFHFHPADPSSADMRDYLVYADYPALSQVAAAGPYDVEAEFTFGIQALLLAVEREIA